MSKSKNNITAPIEFFATLALNFQ
jgi:hypothetical protein